MNQKIDYWDWRDDEFLHLSFTSIDELVEDFLEDEIDDENVTYPITLNINGYKLQNKNEYVPEPIDIINMVRDELYENNYLEDYDISGKDLSEKLLKKANTFRNELMKELPNYYHSVISKTINIFKDGHWEENDKWDDGKKKNLNLK